MAAAEEELIPDANAILDELLRLGLVTEVFPGTKQTIEFAKAYRMQSLLIGLGNTADDPVLDGIGLAWAPPIARVRPRVFEAWQWGHMWPSLWAACEGFAWVSKETGSVDPADFDPVQVLDFLLGALRTLVSHRTPTWMWSRLALPEKGGDEQSRLFCRWAVWDRVESNA